MSDQQNRLAVQQATGQAIRQAIDGDDRWSVVHQACYQAIRTCHQDKPADPAEILWQIICPAVHQAFRNLREYDPYPDIEPPVDEYSRTGDVVWMVIEPAVHRLFLKAAGRADGFQGSVVDCFQAVCQAIQQAVQQNLDSDACLLVAETVNAVYDTDRAIWQAQKAVAETRAGTW